MRPYINGEKNMNKPIVWFDPVRRFDPVRTVRTVRVRKTRLLSVVKLKLANSLLVFALLGCASLLAEDEAAVGAWKKDMQEANKALEQNQFTQANKLYEAALVEAEKFGPDDLRLSETLVKSARVLTELRQTPGAAVALHRALAIDEKRLGTNDFRLAGEYLDLGKLCAFAHRYDEAEAYYLRAQSLAEKKFGRYDRTVGLCILQRASAAMMDDRLEESEKLFKEALEMIESNRTKFNLEVNKRVTASVLAPNKSEVAEALGEMGLLYTKEKKFGDAESAFNRSLKGFEKEYGKNSLHLCTGLYNFAILYVQEGKNAEAEGLLRRSLSILKAADPEHPLVIQTRKLLDAILQARNHGAPIPAPKLNE